MTVMTILPPKPAQESKYDSLDFSAQFAKKRLSYSQKMCAQIWTCVPILPHSLTVN